MALVLTGTSGASNLDSSNGLQFATWTTGTRPASPIAGQMGYNTTTNAFDAYVNGAWVSLTATPTAPYNLAPSNPAFTAQINGNSDATYSTGSNIPFNITGYNRGSNYSTSTYAFTAPVAGVYFFSTALYLSSSSGFTSNYQYGFVKNGSFITFGGPDAVGVVNGSPNANGGTLELTCTWIVNLAVGDTVAVQPRSTSLRVYQGHCYFTGCLIG
jgi:hypothetical protein